MSLAPWTWSPLRTLNDTLRSRTGHRRRAARRDLRREGRSHMTETLESRLMLTTLRGGDTFEYVDRSGSIVRIVMEGNIAAEFVGATVGSNNQAVATNLPGVINGVDVFGGLGGPGGIDIIGRVGGLTADPDINAIAANGTGLMYAFELQEIPIPNPPAGGPDSRNLVFLVQLTFPPAQPPPTPLPAPYGARREVFVTGTRLAEISDEIVAESGGVFPTVNTLPAADFNPDNGLLYFVATGGENNFDKLFTVNVAAGGAAAIEASVNGINGFFNDPGEDGITVASIAFDETPGGAELVALFGTDTGGGAGGGGGGNQVIGAQDAFIGVVNPNNTDFITDITDLNLFDPENPGQTNDEVPELAGIEIFDDDPTQVDDLLAVGPNASFRIIRELTSPFPPGLTIELGALEEPIPPGLQPPDDPTGAAPSGLMFVPNMLDPFTGTLGAYIGFDQAEESNKLFFVNRLEQRPVTIYQIYVAQSDTTGRMAIATVPNLDVSPRPMQPFNGDVGGVRHLNAQDPAQFPWPVDSAGSSTGQVFIGARTIDIPNVDGEDQIPLLTATIPENLNLGLLPVGSFPVDPVTGLRVVGAGITVEGDIDRIMIGGAVTGDVVVSGSINQFYTGWMLTGNARGDVAGAVPSRPQNFRVRGDIRDLYVLDSIGTHSDDALDQPTYITGFDMQAGGNVGHVRSGDSWIGAFQVRNQPEEDPSIGIDIPQSEIEWKTDGLAPAWDNLLFSGNAIFLNDTFDTPEYRGSINNLGQNDMVRSFGTLQHTEPVQDWVDYYAVSLMAGQNVQVQLFTALPLINIGVFDPDGRLIASDHSNSLSASGLPFHFTADRPGSYRFAVSAFSNVNFVNARQSALNRAVPYEFRITDTGDLAVGGIQVANNMLDVVTSESIGQRSYLVEFGDLGELRAGNSILSLNLLNTVRVTAGNLRSLDGGQIGFGTAAAPGDPNNPDDPGTAGTLNAPPQVDVPAGSVGLVRARTGILYFNDGASLFTPIRSIGGSYQLITGASTVFVDIIADGGLGVLRAGDMFTSGPSIITVNFDDTGRDGIIDLIDVVGQMGGVGPGGPVISTNTGGNVRYMRVGGLAFADAAFGGGNPLGTVHLPGEAVTLTDDSGANVRMTPVGQPVPNPAFNPTDPNETDPEFLFTTPNSLAIRAYPIRGSGGSVIMDITSDDSVTIEANGGESGTAEIGTIRLTGARAVGAPVVRNPTVRVGDFTSLLDFFLPETRNRNNTLIGNGLPLGGVFDPVNPGSGGGLGEQDYRRAPNPLILQPRQTVPDPNAPGGGGGQVQGPIKQVLEVIFGGNVKTDIFSIVGVDSGGINGDGQFSAIRNNTPGGEIVNISAVSVGEIVSEGTIGIARSSIPNLALNPAVFAPEASVALPGDTFPYLGQRSGIWIHGDLDEEHAAMPFLLDINQLTQELPEPGNVVSIRARDGLGNIFVNGNIGELLPNKDNLRNRPGVFAGIRGPVWARGNPDVAPVPFSDEGGDIYFVDIGEGIAATGSGNFSRSGLYAGRRIDTVQGTDADIRGDIVAGDLVNPLSVETASQTINGQTVQLGRRISIPDSIGRIVLTNGSIINADILVTTRAFESREQPIGLTSDEYPESVSEPFFELGRIEIRGNGGIIGTFISAADIGVLDVNRGFGVFTTAITLPGDGRFLGIETDNYGIRQVTATVGVGLNFLNARGDGSSVSTAGFSPSVRRSEPQFGAITGALGVDPLTGFQPNYLTDIHAVLGSSQGSAEVPGRTDTGVIEDVDFRGTRSLNVIRAQQIRATFPDLQPSLFNFADRINHVFVRGQINGLSMTTGRMGNFRPEGDVFNLDLTVAGPIKDLLIKGDLAEGSVIRTQGTSGRMGNVRILGRLDGDLLSSRGIKNLFVGESISGNVNASGNKKKAISQLFVGGGLAAGGLNVVGSIGKMTVGGNFGLTGTNFTVSGSIKSLTITGDLYSNITVGGALNRLTVNGSIITGSTIQARPVKRVQVGADVQSGVTFRSTKPPRIVTGGQMLGNIETIA